MCALIPVAFLAAIFYTDYKAHGHQSPFYRLFNWRERERESYNIIRESTRNKTRNGSSIRNVWIIIEVNNRRG